MSHSHSFEETSIVIPPSRSLDLLSECSSREDCDGSILHTLSLHHLIQISSSYSIFLLCTTEERNKSQSLSVWGKLCGSICFGLEGRISVYVFMMCQQVITQYYKRPYLLSEILDSQRNNTLLGKKHQSIVGLHRIWNYHSVFQAITELLHTNLPQQS